MNTYGKWVIAALGVTAVFIAAHFVYTLMRYVTTVRPNVRIPWWQRAVHGVMLAGLLALAGTAFYGVLAQGAMHGWVLFVHSIAAGAVVFTLPVLGICWAGASRLDCCPPVGSQIQAKARFTVLTRLLFWPMLLTGLLMIGAILAGMLGVIDASQQEPAMQVHRYSALVFTCVGLAHAYALAFDRVPIANQA